MAFQLIQYVDVMTILKMSNVYIFHKIGITLVFK